jgi:PEGA domain
MGKFVSGLCSLLLVLQANALPVPASAQAAARNQGLAAPPSVKQPALEDGTPVRLRISQTVSSASAHVGDRVEFEVLEEVKVANTVIIPKGGIAWGTVTKAQPKRRLGRGGKLDIVMDSVRLTDGEKAALRATKAVEGGSHTAGMTAGIVATGLIVWPAAPFFLFMHGKDIAIPKGTEVPTFISGDFPLDLAKFQSPAPATAQASLSSPPNTAAEITITSTPGGADIQLDGSFVGDTPSTVSISAGDHMITITKAGYKPWSRKIKVSGGKIDVAAELEAFAGTGAELRPPR